MKVIQTATKIPVAIAEEDFDKIRKHSDYREYIDSVVTSFVEDNHDDGIIIPPEVLTIMLTKKCSLIRAWREHYKLNQTELAQMLGISQGTLSEIENARNNHPQTLEKVAKALQKCQEKLLSK